jgi:hypothetical protein
MALILSKALRVFVMSKYMFNGKNEGDRYIFPLNIYLKKSRKEIVVFKSELLLYRWHRRKVIG